LRYFRNSKIWSWLNFSSCLSLFIVKDPFVYEPSFPIIPPSIDKIPFSLILILQHPHVSPANLMFLQNSILRLQIQMILTEKNWINCK
jgi:hypothetical protein